MPVAWNHEDLFTKIRWTLFYPSRMDHAVRLGIGAPDRDQAMHITPALLASAAALSIVGAAAAQTTGSAPVVQVPGPVTSAPSSPFGAPAPQLPALPAQVPPPPASPSTPAGPALPSIEGRALPLPSTLTTPRAPDFTRRRDTTPLLGTQGGTALPAPVERPLTVDDASDPVLQIGRESGGAVPFRDAIAAAVERNPALAEAEASEVEARAARAEARAGLFPTADVNVTGYTTVDRDFGVALDNIIERSRPRERTDAQLAVNQTLVDFGATSTRISAASARLRSAAANIDDAAVQISLRTIGAWYDVFTYRTLLAVGRTYQAGQASRRRDFERRVAEGASAQVEVSRLDSSLANLRTRLARYERSVANAEARYAQLTGRPAPATLQRAPFLGQLPPTADDARAAAADVPAVQASVEQAAAARDDARAAARDMLPNISTGIDAGRYGLFERRDYDVRARLSLRMRLGGAQGARLDQIRARANGVAARSSRVREETARDAAIAWADVQALGEQTAALERSYVAARLSRDTIEERFRVSRGTLFDVIDANDAYFGAAAAYVESLADRDAAHYVLLARTGRLLPALQITSAYDRDRR